MTAWLFLAETWKPEEVQPDVWGVRSALGFATLYGLCPMITELHRRGTVSDAVMQSMFNRLIALPDWRDTTFKFPTDRLGGAQRVEFCLRAVEQCD